ncbi:hypothetical protein B0H10DRAFT_1958928 [Mycena sp. CBHHK59/15]|nr:hypothetical protein B0H10DRAFT_1958928 [Mycena sp. CBHHK59/15]
MHWRTPEEGAESYEASHIPVPDPIYNYSAWCLYTVEWLRQIFREGPEQLTLLEALSAPGRQPFRGLGRYGANEVLSIAGIPGWTLLSVIVADKALFSVICEAFFQFVSVRALKAEEYYCMSRATSTEDMLDDQDVDYSINATLNQQLQLVHKFSLNTWDENEKAKDSSARQNVFSNARKTDMSKVFFPLDMANIRTSVTKFGHLGALIAGEYWDTVMSELLQSQPQPKPSLEDIPAHSAPRLARCPVGLRTLMVGPEKTLTRPNTESERPTTCSLNPSAAGMGETRSTKNVATKETAGEREGMERTGRHGVGSVRRDRTGRHEVGLQGWCPSLTRAGCGGEEERLCPPPSPPDLTQVRSANYTAREGRHRLEFSKGDGYIVIKITFYWAQDVNIVKKKLQFALLLLEMYHGFIELSDPSLQLFEALRILGEQLEASGGGGGGNALENSGYSKTWTERLEIAVIVVDSVMGCQTVLRKAARSTVERVPRRHPRSAAFAESLMLCDFGHLLPKSIQPCLRKFMAQEVEDGTGWDSMGDVLQKTPSIWFWCVLREPEESGGIKYAACVGSSSRAFFADITSQGGSLG